MSKAPWLNLAVCLFGLTFVAATCKRNQKPEPAPAVVAVSVTDAGSTVAQLPTPAPDNLPGIPLGVLSEPAQKQLLAFAQDDFCYCGCPHTVQGCLKEHKSCRHSKRMMVLAAGEASAGAKSAEITTLLNQYYASFAANQRHTFAIDEGMCTGPADAPVTLVEFSDFECPYCAAARPILEQLVTAEKGRVRLCFKPFPLNVHPHSMPAAEAAWFAREHGKFWELHDLMFQNQVALDLTNLQGYAAKVGLDPAELAKAIQEEKYQSKITASKEEGKKAGIQGTPSIFINGRPLVLQPGPETIMHAIDDELEWKSNGGHWTQD